MHQLTGVISHSPDYRPTAKLAQSNCFIITVNLSLAVTRIYLCENYLTCLVKLCQIKLPSHVYMTTHWWAAGDIVHYSSSTYTSDELYPIDKVCIGQNVLLQKSEKPFIIEACEACWKIPMVGSWATFMMQRTSRNTSSAVGHGLRQNQNIIAAKDSVRP
jgi:hypothetical protein